MKTVVKFLPEKPDDIIGVINDAISVIPALAGEFIMQQKACTKKLKVLILSGHLGDLRFKKKNATETESRLTQLLLHQYYYCFFYRPCTLNRGFFTLEIKPGFRWNLGRAVWNYTSAQNVINT